MCRKITQEIFENELSLKFPNKSYKIIGNYFGVGKKILIENKYGKCFVKAGALLRGQKPCITSSINKTEYFVNAAKEIHGNLYDYSKFEYDKNFKNSIIICKLHGDFQQSPGSHLKGFGCLKCSIENKGYGRTDFLRASKGRECLLYILRIFNENENFYKVGITSRNVQIRFKSKLPYNYEILYEFKSKNSEYIWNLENKIKNDLKDKKYMPNMIFCGAQECFSINPLTLILKNKYV